tara:strand:+ start:65 stop:322 length:258 start_codon:yes stop_codon:yes gene_type:complete
MTIKYHGGPAFPVVYDEHDDEFQDGQNGMTLRDYFAGQVITGAASDPDGKMLDFTYCAYYAYKIADLMLLQRDVVAPIAKEGDDE